MKTYKIKYNSERNIFSGELFTKSESPSKAMDVFFEWLKEQSVWTHLWRINIEIEEIKFGDWI
jgi:hypothetical protein